MKSAIISLIFATTCACFAIEKTNSPPTLVVTPEMKRAAIVDLNKYYDVKPDKFRDRTTIREKRYQEAIGIELRSFAFMAGTNAPTKASISIFSISREWRFLNGRDAVFVFGNNKKRFGEDGLSYSGDVASKGVHENMWADFTLEEFRLMAHAANVEIKLYIYTPLIVPYEERAGWRALAKYLDILAFEQSAKAKKSDAKTPAKDVL
jgi:hypothetical protein